MYKVSSFLFEALSTSLKKWLLNASNWMKANLWHLISNSLSYSSTCISHRSWLRVINSRYEKKANDVRSDYHDGHSTFPRLLISTFIYASVFYKRWIRSIWIRNGKIEFFHGFKKYAKLLAETVMSPRRWHKLHWGLRCNVSTFLAIMYATSTFNLLQHSARRWLMNIAIRMFYIERTESCMRNIISTLSSLEDAGIMKKRDIQMMLVVRIANCKPEINFKLLIKTHMQANITMCFQ